MLVFWVFSVIFFTLIFGDKKKRKKSLKKIWKEGKKVFIFAAAKTANVLKKEMVFKGRYVPGFFRYLFRRGLVARNKRGRIKKRDKKRKKVWYNQNSF